MVTHIERRSRIERPRSASAVWCQRLAVFCVPFLLIIVLGHRAGAIETPQAFWLIGLAVLLLLASFIAGIYGFYELWTKGYEAGLKSSRGMALSLLLLLPFLWFGLKAFALPPLYDISTDLEDPPAFDTVVDDRTDAMNSIVEPNEVSRKLQLVAYPRVSARRYPLDSGRIFKEVVALIGERDWTILTANTTQGEAPIDEEGSGLVAKSVTDGQGRPLRIPLPSVRPQNNAIAPNVGPNTTPAFETVQVSPVGRGDSGVEEEQAERYVEAVATSFLFGFESDTVIRMVEEEEGTLVDMRSSSRWGPHDLGSNATRVREFMEDLDTALQGLGQGG